MRKAIYWLSSVVTGIAGGLFAVYLAVDNIAGNNAHEVGPWATNTAVGSVDADAQTRAAVSIHGLLGLDSKEAIYYIAEQDSSGAPLSGSCTYSITLDGIAAKWWSMTTYDADGYLMDNSQSRYSFTKSDVETGSEITVSATEQAGQWLPVKSGEPFDLTIRLYSPEAAIHENPGNTRLPEITRRSCS